MLGFIKTISLASLVDYIILFGALCVAVGNIYKTFAKPTSYFKRKREEEERARIRSVLDEKLPEILYAHDLETREKYKSDRQNYLEEIKAEVLEDVGGKIDKIMEMNEKQNKTIETLARSSRDILREKIMGIYHKGVSEKRMAIYEKEALEQYYIDYKAEGGNSYIDKYYKRMSTWQIDDTDLNEYDD